MTERGVRLLGWEVGRARDTTSVRVRDGELQLTDGPFAEAKEQMAGPIRSATRRPSREKPHQEPFWLRS